MEIVLERFNKPYYLYVALASKKYVLFSIHRPPKENIKVCLYKPLEALLFYSRNDEGILHCEFDATPSNLNLTLFFENKDLKNLI